MNLLVHTRVPLLYGLNPTIKTEKVFYIKNQTEVLVSTVKWYILLIPWDLPDIYALARGLQARWRGHIYQANPDWPWYKLYI